MSGKRERAVWGLTEEQVLLELFRQARNDPQVRSDRGVKARGWASIMAEINRRCNRAFDKDQLKSKYARLMQEYELFKSVGGHKGRLDDSDWEQAMREKPRNVTLLKQFKAHGFAHTDICSRIVGDKEDSEDILSLPLVPESSAEIVGLKRSPSVQVSELEIKRARMEARHDPDVRSDKGIRGRGWVEVIAELNKQCNTSLDKEQVKSKFARLMQEFDTFKEATGFSGDPDTAPQSANDWDQLIDERPEFLNQLVQFKEKNGFPHIELCSLITEDSPTTGLKLASLSNFLATGVVQVAGGGNVTSHQQQAIPSAVSTASVGSTPVSLAANALPFLLPARAATLAAQLQPPARHAQPEAAETPVGVDPNFFTPELRNNLNTFLKTATAYLVMLINDHNQEGDF
ncbi:hypothetical protein BBJ29_006452 [Phytophthora kernoviae]|uniref:Myb/SANT-like domain-containing protein n=1 Tax=Phytophthora kernoviae TaxID=325452 RepID=A0A3F2S0G6_9STRA|nr:hypothetical protein BBJ29_006452 [Phytophthora kernoviae]RLN67035.1 hypothetical protein BBP00_00001859 [Phytophthora kernoviae]